jgi:hypothetical protein
MLATKSRLLALVRAKGIAVLPIGTLARIACLAAVAVTVHLGFAMPEASAVTLDMACIKLSSQADQNKQRGCYRYQCTNHCKLSRGGSLCTRWLCTTIRRPS